jgi:hypothetical protein
MLKRLSRREPSPDILATARIEASGLGLSPPDPLFEQIGDIAVTLRPRAVKALLVQQVAHSDLADATKVKLSADLAALDASAFQGVAERMVEAALLQARAELHLLQGLAL